MSGLDIPLEGKGIRQLCGTVLIMEAIVIGLAILPAIVLEHANRGLAGGIGGALAVCAVLIGGMVGRPGMAWAVWAGTVLQLLVIAAGVVVPAMYVLGVIFAALWVTGLWLVRRHETPAPQPSSLPLPAPQPSAPQPSAPQPSAPSATPHPRAPASLSTGQVATCPGRGAASPWAGPPTASGAHGACGAKRTGLTLVT